MIIGAHAIIQSKAPDADRAFFRDILGFRHLDVGGGWLVFALPPSEFAVHPSSRNDVHELFFMCDDIEEFRAAMRAQGIRCTRLQTLSWGQLTRVTLPGGGAVGVYQPRHGRPRSSRPRKVGGDSRSTKRAT